METNIISITVAYVATVVELSSVGLTKRRNLQILLAEKIEGVIIEIAQIQPILNAELM